MKNFRPKDEVKFSRKWSAQFPEKPEMIKARGVITDVVGEEFKIRKANGTHIDATLVNVLWSNQTERQLHFACNLTQIKEID